MPGPCPPLIGGSVPDSDLICGDASGAPTHCIRGGTGATACPCITRTASGFICGAARSQVTRTSALAGISKRSQVSIPRFSGACRGGCAATTIAHLCGYVGAGPVRLATRFSGSTVVAATPVQDDAPVAPAVVSTTVTIPHATFCAIRPTKLRPARDGTRAAASPIFHRRCSPGPVSTRVAVSRRAFRTTPAARGSSVAVAAVRATGRGGCSGASRGPTARIWALSSDLRPDAPYSGVASAICTARAGTPRTRLSPLARPLKDGGPGTPGFS